MLEPIIINLQTGACSGGANLPETLREKLGLGAVDPDAFARNPTAVASHNVGQLIFATEAQRQTRAEMQDAKDVPLNSPQPTLAETRRRFLRERSGPSYFGCEIEGEKLWIKRLNFGESIVIATLLPLDNATGLLDATRSDELTAAAAEVLRLGLYRQADASAPYFENKQDSLSFMLDDVCADFAAQAIVLIDSINGIFPKRGTPPPAPKTRAEEYLERLREKEAAQVETASPVAPL